MKRVQIRAGRANEAVLVKRLSERLQRDLDRQGVLYLFLFVFYICFIFHFLLLIRTGKGGNTILMKYSSGLFRVAGLRSYQGEFTFSGLEEHLFSELRRFRSGKEEVPEKLHSLVSVDFLFKRLFFLCDKFLHFSACIQQLNCKTEPRVFEQRKKVTNKIKLKRKYKLAIYLYISAFVGVSYHR